MLQTKHKAHKFRIYPSPSQQAKLAEFFGSVRFVYNHYLNVKKQSFEESGQSLSYTACAKDLVSFKKEHSFLRDVDSIALQQSLRHLDTAFQNFFRNKEFGYPKYKSRKKHRDSYSTICVNGNIRLEGNSIGRQLDRASKDRKSPYSKASAGPGWIYTEICYRE